MFKTILKIAVRNLLKDKLYSSINVIGLAVGLAAVMCIAIYIKNELSYDRFQVNKKELYRIGITTYREGAKMGEGYTYTPPIGPAMKAELAGVKNYTRYRSPREAYFSTDEKSLKTKDVIFVDSSFLSLFSFPLIAGDPNQSLNAPYSLVLTESLSNRLFGHTDVLSKTIRLNNGDELQVTAVVQDPPANSHIQFQALISFSTLYKDKSNYMGWNGGEQYVTYVQLHNNTSFTNVEKALPEFMWHHVNKEFADFNMRLDAKLQAMEDIHLYHNQYSSSLLTNLYIMALMSFLILLMACINFINITTARSSRRAKEVGVRKVLGATKTSLGGQFLGEAFLLTSIAFLLSLFLVEMTLPILPRLFGKVIITPILFQWTTASGLLLLLGIVSIGVGIYPSVHLASLNTAKTLKGLPIGHRKSKFRNSLVVFQFVISTVLIISMLVITQQLKFTKTKTLGFDKENTLVVPLIGAAVQTKINSLKQELKKSPKVLSVTACSEIPGTGFTRNGYRPEGIEEPMLINVVDVDDDFFNVFDLHISDGRALSLNKPNDKNAYLINQALADLLKWEHPVGKKIKRNGEHEIVGVVKDFHFASLHESIQPLIVTCDPLQGRFDYLAVKLTAGNLEQGVQATQKAWKEIFLGVPMDHWFLDDEINQIYQSERRLQSIFLWCSGLSIFIALMGVFGLTSFSVEQRRKEIGIRKVLGATTSNIVGMLSKDFLKLVLFAFVIAAPLSYYLMKKWLADFTYHIEMQWWMFVIVGIAAMIVAFLTVSLQSVKAALANPIKSLRSE